MSNLNPGGRRNTGGMIFGARAITHHCKQALKARDAVQDAQGSIAKKPHGHSREMQRRLRQQQRREQAL